MRSVSLTLHHPVCVSVAANAALGEGDEPVRLETLLRENFQDNRIRGLRRQLPYGAGEKPLDAWRMLAMLPFYSAAPEAANNAAREQVHRSPDYVGTPQ